MEEIFAQVGAQTTELKRCAQMRARGPTVVADEHILGLLAGLDKAVSEMEAATASHRAHLTSERAQLKRGTAMLEAVRELENRTQYTHNNLPEKLPGYTSSSSMMPLGDKANSSNRRANSSAGSSTSSSSSSSSSAVTRKKRSASTVRIAKLAYVKVDEFEEVPKYIRGRLKRDQVNEIVDAVHVAMVEKYRILNTPRNKLGQQAMEQWRRFREQEVKETAGQRFFIEDDLRTFTDIQVNSAVRSSMVVLRHLGRLREVRGSGVTRLVALTF